jgi:2-dehydropantoate 2-reductase
MTKKIAVLGTGANGSCVAADLTRSGRDVTLIDQWPAHVEKMKADGLTINMPNETVHVAVRAEHICDVCSLGERFDVVFLLVKAFDARWMAEFIKPYLADDGLLIGIQNGMTAESIAEIVGPQRTLGCAVELSSELFDPGIVKRNTPPERTWIGIGALDPSMEPRLPEIQEILSDVGTVDIVDNILSAKWMKLIINAMSMGIKGITNMTTGEIFQVPGMREIMLRAGEEAFVVGQELGFKSVAIIGLKPEDLDGTNRLCELMLDQAAAHVGLTNKVAVLQDHLKGRYSEVDQINGYVADESEKRGLKAPVNRAVTEITKRIHAGELKPDATNVALIREALGL